MNRSVRATVASAEELRKENLMSGKPKLQSTPRHISVVAVPDSTASTLFGIYDVLAYVERLGLASSGSAPFHVDIVGEARGPLALASGVTVDVQRALGTLDARDVLDVLADAL